MGKRRNAQGANPTRVAAAQARLRSGAYGTHKQPTDRPRAEQERQALLDEDTHDDE